MKDFVTALQFLTRIKIASKVPTTEDDFSRSLKYFPLVGLILGSILGFLAMAMSGHWGSISMAVLLLATEIILTGGLHLDGFMDSCDGLFSGRSKERMLEIMKDSRVGAMGVIGLFLLLTLKIALITELSDNQLFYALFMTPFFSRWAVLYTINKYPYARKEGLGKYFTPGRGLKSFAVVSVFCLIVASLFAILFSELRLLWALPVSAFAVITLCNRINTVIGGHTGDTYGAVIETTELVVLFFIVIITKI